MDAVNRMVDRANAVIADEPPGTDASQIADDLLELAGMYRSATSRAVASETAYGKLAAQLATVVQELDEARRSAAGLRGEIAGWQARAEAAERRIAELEPLAEQGRLVERMPVGYELKPLHWDYWRVSAAAMTFVWHGKSPAEALRAALGEPAKA